MSEHAVNQTPISKQYEDRILTVLPTRNANERPYLPQAPLDLLHVVRFFNGVLQDGERPQVRPCRLAH